jgi:predicted Rossmann-fold nucleotide-binding protein
MLTWAQLGFHQKPCGLLNIQGYYSLLYRFLEHAMQEHFVRDAYRAMLLMEDNAADLLDRFATYRAPRVKKWISADET